MARKITLIVEDNEIKLLVTGKGRVETWASIPLDPGLVNNGVVVDEDKVAGQLREQLRLLNIRARRVIIGLSGLNSLYRLVSMPELPDSMLPEAVKHEAERIMPISPNDVYISFQRLPSVAGETRVFIATFPKSATDSLVRTLHKAGLEPYLMDLAPLAFSRTVGAPRAIVVNFQANSLDIVIMVDRVPQVIRSISLAEVESFQEQLATITEEIERTIAFYNSTEKEKPLDNTVPVLVCGELAKQPENLQLIAGKLGMPVEVMLPPLESPQLFDACHFMVNMGLSLKEREKGAAEFSLVNFNALPEFYIPKHISLPNVLAPVGIVVTAGMVIVMVFVSTSTSAHSESLRLELNTVRAYLNQQQKDLTASRTRLTQLEDQLKPMTANNNILTSQLDSLKNGRDQTERNLNTLLSLLPPEINLATINQTGDAINISGTSSNQYIIYDYQRSLANSNRFSGVQVQSIAVTQVAQPPSPSTLEGGASTTPTGLPQIVLSWVDNSKDETKFSVERAKDYNFQVEPKTFELGPNITRFIDDSIEYTGVVYYYRVFAVNPGGLSEASNTFEIAAPVIPLPAAPGGLSALAESPQPAATAPEAGPQPAQLTKNYVFSMVVKLKIAAKPAPSPTPAPTTTPMQTPTPSPVPKTPAATK